MMKLLLVCLWLVVAVFADSLVHYSAPSEAAASARVLLLFYRRKMSTDFCIDFLVKKNRPVIQSLMIFVPAWCEQNWPKILDGVRIVSRESYFVFRFS